MLERLRNPDIAAIVTMLLALAAEAVTQIANDESLLGQLPPWLAPVLLTIAALLRLRSGGVISGASGTSNAMHVAPDPEQIKRLSSMIVAQIHSAAVPTEVDNEVDRP